ncbi:acyltransferase [Coleophoma cylindrospora]|uniref:Acyltransferase n=1 Tax=Coleophoma cylindrospora TaxID=1849047 RepID=A0A3D8SPQ7_9HELO|nr:acyltransferase [Coleophoma cylindrospora]
MPGKHEGLLEYGSWEDRPERRLSLLYRAAKWCIDLIRPSYLSKAGSRRQFGRTAYLDGLRGFAALLVYFGHHHLWARDAIKVENIFDNAFGYNKQYYFACLPGVRMFFSGGHYAVSVFFVISGYVLSAKALSQAYAGEYTRLGDTLASALFRRWLRLFIPLIVTTFAFMTTVHAFSIWTDDDREPTYHDELWKWYVETKNFTFLFRTGGVPWLSYNRHLWSIPMEFKGSVVIFTAIQALSRCSRNARLWCEVILIYYFMYIVDGWFCSMFLAGMLLCDLDLLARNNDLPRFFLWFENYRELLFYNLLIASIYLGGIPIAEDVKVLRDSPGWYYLSMLKPQAVYDYKWFYLFWAAVWLVACVPQIPWLKAFCEMRFNQYLGRISYAFYLIHGPLLQTFADRLYVATGWSREAHAVGAPTWINFFPLSKEGPLGLDFSFWVPQLIILPVTLWAAEIVTKLVDEPAVNFAQWAYKKALAPSTLPKI